MPRYRRKKTNTKDTHGSSSDSECSKTLEIITKMSEKYLSTYTEKVPTRKSPRNKDSPKSDLHGYEGDEENTSCTTDCSPPSSLSSSSSNMSIVSNDAFKAYEFDEPELVMDVSLKEKKTPKSKVSKAKTQRKQQKSKTLKAKDTPTSHSTKKSPVTADKQCAKRKSRKSPLSPIPLNIDTSCYTPKVSYTASVTPGKVSSKQLKVKKDCTVSFTESISSPGFSKTPVVSLKRLDISNVEGYESFQRQLRKRKSDTLATNQTVSQSNAKILKPSKLTKEVKKTSSKKKVSTKLSDSGLCEPSPVKRKRKGLLPAATDTSTPSNSLKTKKTAPFIGDDSCFGFSGMDTPAPSLNVSPVRRINLLTPMSDYASMDSMQISYEEVPVKNNLELFSLDDNDYSLNKSVKKSYKPSKKGEKRVTVHKNTKKADRVLEKMNFEFDEIEKFQLSIEEV